MGVIKKRKTAYVLFGLVCILVLSACGKRTDVKEESSFIYCLNSDRTGLIKVTYDIEEKDSLKAAKEVIHELQKTPEDIDYSQPLRKGVKINTIKQERELLYVDFNKGYEKIPPIEEKLVRAAVVQSLIRIDGISGVWFSMDGQDITDDDGKVLGYLTEDDFVQNTGSSPSSYQSDTLTLYFANEAGDKLVEHKVDVKYSSNMSKEKLIVDKLLKGPKKNAGHPTLNPNTSILGVTIKDEICYVNLDDEFLIGGFDVKPEIAIYSLINSLVEGTLASKVQIMVNGNKKISYKETVELVQPLERDMSWVEEK